MFELMIVACFGLALCTLFFVLAMYNPLYFLCKRERVNLLCSKESSANARVRLTYII